jgi:hypothetical protein
MKNPVMTMKMWLKESTNRFNEPIDAVPGCKTRAPQYPSNLTPSRQMSRLIRMD